MAVDRSAITARIIAFPPRTRVRVLLAGWDSFARRAIEPLARELGAQVLRAPFTAADVRDALFSLRGPRT